MIRVQQVSPNRLRAETIDDPTVERWFDQTAFVVVPDGQFRFGNSGHIILIGPGGISLDVSLLEKFRLPWNDQTLQLRAEIFNVANRANFGQPDARIDQPTAGVISTASPGRQIQFAVKYMF